MACAMQLRAMAAAVLALAVSAAATGASAARSEVTPVQKVIQLLEGMSMKGKEEKHKEEVQFATFKQFCDDTTAEKQRAIKGAEEVMLVLKADIQQYSADSTRLTKEIAGHDEDISVWTGDKQAVTKVREMEKADYDRMHKDYSESVDALRRAIAVLKEEARESGNPNKAAFSQVAQLRKLVLIPAEAKRAIDQFLQEEPDAEGLEVSAPEAGAYDFQSSAIIGVLEKLLDKFVDERTSLQRGETNAQHAYELLTQDLKAQVDQAQQDRGEKAGVKASKLQAKADASGDLSDTTSTRDADEKYLADITSTCAQKASDFESRQQLRAEELEAIERAMEILRSSAVSGNAGKYLPAMLQGKRGALAHLRSDARAPYQEHVAIFLRQQARHLNSRVLSALAVHAEEDPFGKVKKMIKDLLVRLMEEANEEAEHKGWCDTELATNEQTRKEKSEAVETLHAEVDELESSIAKLGEDVAELSQAVADLDAAMAEATKIRHEEKATNEQTVKDSQDAQSAVAQALTVLREFFEKAGDATAFVQDKQKQPGMPAIFDSPYKGMQAENGGVIGMLEVIESDFARLEAETSATEAASQKEYDEFMTDSKVDKAQKAKDVEHKTAKRQDEEQALQVKRADVQGTQKELDAALAYFDKLKPSCVDSGVSYDDRVSRRKEEIESLQEALRILNGEDIAL